jgi:hypothetical protein
LEEIAIARLDAQRARAQYTHDERSLAQEIAEGQLVELKPAGGATNVEATPVIQAGSFRCIDSEYRQTSQ